MKNKLLLTMLLLAAAISVSGLAGALGVSGPFLEDNTLGVQEGKATTMQLVLQNTDDEPVLTMFQLSSDGNIASVVDPKPSYLLPAKSISTVIVLNITAPRDAKIGGVYTVKYSFGPVQPSGGGTIAFIPGISRNFKVKITRDSDKFYFGQYLKEKGLMWLLIITILAGYVAYGIYKRKKGKSRKIF